MKKLARTGLTAFLCFAPAQTFGQVPGPSTNMVSGTQWPGGDPYLQRQNEPSMAISSRNPLHLLAGANDYRSVDIPFAAAVETGDAWLGLFKSYDGGQTWTSTLIPGYPQDTSSQGTSSPVHGLSAAADPIVRAGTNGMLYFSGLAFNRTAGAASQIFLSRFIDDNNLQGGDTIRYLSTSTVATGTATNFFDKPSIAVDIPRAGAHTCTIPASSTAPAQSFLGGRIYAAYTNFVGGEGSSIAAIFLTQSSDCGVTWTTPVQISGPQQTNQGASLAINPVTGDLYVVWRVFAAGTTKDGLGGIVKPYTVESVNENSFVTPAVQIVTFTPFDQGTTNVSFRTNDYPSLATDGSGHIYVAWSERVGPSSDSRIVVSAGQGRTSEFDVIDLLFPKLTAAAIIDPDTVRGHQIMPALAFSSGKLTAAWYDFRDDDEVAVYTPEPGGLYTYQLVPDGQAMFGLYIQDPVAPLQPASRRQTVEVRAAQAPPGLPPVFNRSIIVSQYAFGTPEVNGAYSSTVQQIEFDAPNLPMFEQGEVPFFGDYIDVAGPTFIPTGTTWRANYLATDPDHTHVVWTDNRNVIEPADGNWANYTPPGVAANSPSTFNGTPRVGCTTGNSGNTGDRNQDIYTAAITPGLVVGAKGNSKQLSPTLQRQFPVTVQNTTSSPAYFRLAIEAQTVGGYASFVQVLPVVTQLDISVPALSSASRSLFVTSTNPAATVQVMVQQITGVNGSILPSGLTSSVALNADVSNPNISNPNISNVEIYNPNISNPNISNPNISNPNISNPNISNPNISNPNISNADVANPNISNPNISNPNISNPNISNPNISNPNISNPNISNPNISNTSLADVSSTVSNTGNSSASYSLQLIQNQQLPNQVIVQAIVSKVYLTPIASGCALLQEPHYQPIINVTNPTFTSTGSLGGTNPLDPAAPTFALEPGESVLVTLRYYVPSTVPSFNPLTAIAPVVASVGANTGATIPPLTLTITTASLSAATASVANTQQLAAVGGTGTGYTWAPVGSLPAGVTLSGTGKLSIATNAIAGAYTITVQVTDSGNNSVSKGFNLVINAAPMITTNSLNPGDQGFPYSQQLMATGGTLPITWSATSLPGGVTLSGTTGVLSGTPTAAGTFSPAITVTDANGGKATGNFSVTIAQPLGISPNTITNPEQGAPYTTTLTASGGTGTPTWSITGNLPAGLTFNSGVISGTTSASGGSYPITVKITDTIGASASLPYTITITPAPTVGAATLSAATINRPITSTQLSATGGSGSYTWAATSGLPAGVTLSTTGLLSGTPTAAGSFTITVKVTDSAGGAGTSNVALTVNPAPAITSTSLNAGEQGVAYPPQQLGATGGTTPLVWSATGLPTGLTLSTSGLLTGQPTAAGPFSPVVTVADANGATASQTYSGVSIAAPLMITTTAVSSFEQGVTYNIALTMSGGSGTPTFSITGSVPAGMTFNAGTGTISGSPTGTAAASFTIKATDGLGGTVSLAYSVTITLPPSVTPTTLSTVMVNQPITAAPLTATGGSGGYTWTVNTGSTLPPGLSLSAGGVLSGAPMAAGSYSFSVKATDSAGGTGVGMVTLTVIPAGPALWNLTGSMNTPRLYHSAVLLQNGQVLVFGGINGNTYLNSAELYDPSTGTWTFTGSISTPRAQMGSVLLANGTVLAAAGITTGGGPVSSAELYNPATGTWSPTGSLPLALQGPSASVLLNGNVLVSGGSTGGGIITTATELYDPNTGAWTATGVQTAGQETQATVLANGQVLVAGGGTSCCTVNNAEIYDPVAGTWSNTNPLLQSALGVIANLLPGGNVLVASGSNASVETTTAELYNPNTGAWTYTGSLTAQRYYPTSAQLANGKVLITGGGPGTAELYDPSAGTWSGAGSLSAARASFTETLLANGQILVAGGNVSGATVASAELYGQPTLTITTQAYLLNLIGIPEVTVNAAITPITLSATGGSPGYTWAITSGSVPTGLALSNTGVLSGTPTQTGTFTFAVTLTDSVGATAVANFSMTVGNAPVQVSAGPVAGFQNYTYAATLLGATGGVPPYSWTGSLPTGMSVSSAGLLTGFPTVAGTFSVSATDSFGATASASFVIGAPSQVQGAGGPSVTTVSNIILNSSGNVQIVAQPGAPVTVAFNFSLIEGTGYCPGCIDQIATGFVGSLPSTCQYDGQPGPGGTGTLAGSIALTAPTTPGRYYIGVQKTQQYYCSGSGSGPGAINIPISPNAFIVAVVDVIPPTVTYQNVTLSNISVTTPLVAAGSTQSVNATFTTNAPSSGTFGFGYNVSPAPLSCGGLNLNAPGSVTLDAPALAGRYYLAIDNLQTCSVSAWVNGVPGSNFARFIGAIDVQIAQ